MYYWVLSFVFFFCVFVFFTFDITAVSLIDHCAVEPI